ncbi:MAG TPA: DUF4442 domain-containing protein [Thermoanaerobaculia bacterium]|nr:DUF4442 domain-containing protein [Thermoanaerobaculia bacterium]
MIEPTAVPVISTARSGAFEKRRRQMLNPFLMRLYYLGKLPLAFVAGLRLRELDAGHAVVTVPYGWRTTNPFRSTYFAALSMAAELSTGALAKLATDLAPRPVAMLIVGLTASFEKKATATTTFTCAEGDKVAAAIARTVETGEPATAEVETIGRSPDGTVVARFTFTWSFKARSRKS